MIPYDLPPAFMVGSLFILGAILGSFLTVCVHRLPRHENVFAAWWSLVKGGSHCDRCEKPLQARDNIPILGWLFLRGKCRFCQQPIPARYPLIELVNGLLFALIYAMEVPFHHWIPISASCLSSSLGGLNFDNDLGLSSAAMVNFRFLYHLILVEMLLVVTLIDWEEMVIPDSVTLPALIAGVAGAATFGKFWLVPVWFQNPDMAWLFAHWLPESWVGDWMNKPVPTWIAAHPHWHGLCVSLAGLTAGGGIMLLVRWLGRLALQREVLGMGDVILMSAIGAFIGWQPVIVIFYVAPLLTLVVALSARLFQLDREVSYGPYISVATFVVLFGWRWIWPSFEWYFSLGPILIVIACVLVAALPALLVGVRFGLRALGLSTHTPDLVGTNEAAA